MVANQPDIKEVLDQFVQLQQELATLQQVNANLQTTVNTLLNAAPVAPAQQQPSVITTTPFALTPATCNQVRW